MRVGFQNVWYNVWTKVRQFNESSKQGDVKCVKWLVKIVNAKGGGGAVRRSDGAKMGLAVVALSYSYRRSFMVSR